MKSSQSSRWMFVLTAIFAVLLAATLDAQRGGGGRGGKGGGGRGGKGGGGRGGGRFDEVRARLNPSFVSVVPPAASTQAPDGAKGSGDASKDPAKDPAKDPVKDDPAAHFERFREIAASGKIGRPSLLYLYSAQDPEKLGKFEQRMLTFRAEALCCGFKAYTLLKLDVGRDPVAREAFEKKLPVFLAFDKEGKFVDDVSLRGYKPNPNKVLKLLYKAAKGYGTISLQKFVAGYRKFINKWDQLARDKKTLAQKVEASGGAPSKKLRKEQEKLDERERELLETEKELLDAIRPTPPKAKAGSGAS